MTRDSWESEPLPPVVNLTSSGEEVGDPVGDLRLVIEQLRSRARDQRAHAQGLEREKERLEEQLGAALAELHTARQRETALRAKTGEAGTLMMQRDDAAAAAGRNAKTIAELQKCLVRAREEQEGAARQREAMAKQLAGLTRSAEAASGQSAHSQKQVLAIRMARDAAQAQIHKLQEKLSAAKDEIAELGYQRQAAARAEESSTSQLETLRREYQAVSRDRDRLVAQIAELNAEVDQHRARMLDLAEDHSHANAIDSELTASLAQARLQVAGLTRECEAGRERALEQSQEVESLRMKLQALEAELATLRDANAELEELRLQRDMHAAEIAAHVARGAELTGESAAQQEQLTALADELAKVQRRSEEAFARAEAAQFQIDELIRERDAEREAHTEDSLILEAQITALRTRDEELVEELEAAGHREQEREREFEKQRERARRAEVYRMESIELAGKLDSAQRDIIELTASLAEARLKAKFIGAEHAKMAAAQTARTPEAAPADAVGEEAADQAHEVSDESPEVNECFSEKEARGALVAMRRCYQAFARSPSDLSQLNEIYSHAHGFAERARVSGLVALHRLSAAFASLTHHLYRVPESLNPSTMRTVQQTIEFLTALVRERNLTHLRDPARAEVYVVDDDPENCHAIGMALEMVMLRTISSQEPSVALAEISAGRFDLILLDINLPGMDGFELCEHVRKTAAHERTPIVFLTGLNTLERRVQSTLSGGNDFIAKPFNLHELGVKSLTLILKTQLGIV